MKQLENLLSQRTKKSGHQSKMTAMAQQSAQGQLNSFVGLFGIAELNDKERTVLKDILVQYNQEFGGDDAEKEETQIENDLKILISITSEVKAIHNQAVILHGERIKRAHDLLIRYREGAFTAWLKAAYGNRQTPYNFMQYYELHEAISRDLRTKLEQLPKQAAYTLASRQGSLEKKEELILNYQGETKAIMLERIRVTFPLDEKDKRKEKPTHRFFQHLQGLKEQTPQCRYLTPSERNEIIAILDEIKQMIHKL